MDAVRSWGATLVAATFAITASLGAGSAALAQDTGAARTPAPADKGAPDETVTQLEGLTVLGSRRYDRSSDTDTPVPVDVLPMAKAAEQGAFVRSRPDPAIHRALVHLEAPDRCRQCRSRSIPPRCAASARTRPWCSSTASAALDRAGQPVRRAQPRQYRHRPQHDSAAGDRSGRNPARRRRRAVRLRRDRRRDEHRAEDAARAAKAWSAMASIRVAMARTI